jgi:hypothetical protein
MSDDGPLPWKRPLSKGVKHRYLTQFLTHLKHLKGHIRVLRVDMVGKGVFIHGGFGLGPRTTTKATATTITRRIRRWIDFQKIILRGVEEMEAALSGCFKFRSFSHILSQK